MENVSKYRPSYECQYELIGYQIGASWSGSRHVKTCLRAYTDSEGDSDGPGQTDLDLCCPLLESFDTIVYIYITKTRLFKYVENFTSYNENF